MPYSSQDSMQPTDHGFNPSFEQLYTDDTETSCLSTPQLCHSLFDIINGGGGWSFLSGWISCKELGTQKNPAVLEDPSTSNKLCTFLFEY